MSSESLQATLRDGSQMDVPFSLLDMIYRSFIKQSISFGTQVGASAIMLFMMIILTKSEKRLKPIFIATLLALLFNIGRALTFLLYLTGPFTNAYGMLTDDFEDVPHWAMRISSSSDILGVLTTVAVSIVILCQVKAICTDITMPNWFRHSSVGLVGITALIAIAFRTATTIMNSIYIRTGVYQEGLDKVARASNITFTMMVSIASLFLMYKLRIAISNRRNIQIANRLTPMQVLFIVAFQTMFFPAVFSVCMHFVTSFDALIGQVQSFVCISLPMASIWAMSVTSHRIDDRERNPWDLRAQILQGLHISGRKQAQADLSPVSPSFEKTDSLPPFADGKSEEHFNIFNQEKIPERTSDLDPVIAPCPSDNADSISQDVRFPRGPDRV